MAVVQAGRSTRSLGSMDAWFLVYGLGVTLGWPVLVLGVLLSHIPRTRYFAISVVLGAVGGIIAAVSDDRTPPIHNFLIAYSVIAIPLGLICGVVAIIDLIVRRPKRKHAASH